MALDRLVHWVGKRPALWQFDHFLKDYFGGRADVSFDGSTWHCIFSKGVGVEVFWDNEAQLVDVITIRQMPRRINRIADDFADCCARKWHGELEPP